MATRYPNAFFGYSGFVTAAAEGAKTASGKGSKAVPARASIAAQRTPKGSAAHGRPQTKAA